MRPERSERLNFTLRLATDEDFQFAFAAKRDAIGPHVAVRWGWDDAVQLQHHRRRWQEKPWQIILVSGNPVGTVSIDVQATHLQFGEFYVTEGFRRQGLGTAVLLSALSLADRSHLETRLEYLKWNPVASLYARHGFRVTAESDTHYFLVRPPHTP